MQLNKLLQEKNISFFFIQPGNQNDIVVSAIHHAPAGVSNLPCVRHKNSDEAVGQLAHKISNKLDSTLIIASNYFLDINKPDPNIKKKEDNTDYLTWLFHNKPQVLIEIHGHSGDKSIADIEISSGKHNNGLSIEFARKLRHRMKRSRFERSYSVSGDYDKITYKATEAVSINSSMWQALHIELCPELRKNSKEANKIANCVAFSIKEILVEKKL